MKAESRILPMVLPEDSGLRVMMAVAGTAPGQSELHHRGAALPGGPVLFLLLPGPAPLPGLLGI